MSSEKKQDKLKSTSVAKGLYVVVGSFEYQKNFFEVPSAFDSEREDQECKFQRLRLSLKGNQKVKTLADKDK